jgi:mannose-1-phosphate guanylyltransferase / phosphomannomutase
MGYDIDNQNTQSGSLPAVTLAILRADAGDGPVWSLVRSIRAACGVRESGAMPCQRPHVARSAQHADGTSGRREMNAAGRMRKAIVMAGGQGERLRPLTSRRPKPLVSILNRPLLGHILEWLKGHGFTDVLITLHYRADEIRRAVAEATERSASGIRTRGLRITCQVEDRPMGTAGSVKLAEAWLDGEPFLVVSGDVLTDVDLAALQRRHRQSGAWLTLGVKAVEEPSRFGVVERDPHGRVLRFQEKPARGTASSTLVNTGIYCVEPQVLARVRKEQNCDWSRDVFPGLLAEGRPLFAEELAGYWCDVGTFASYALGQQDALQGRVRVSVPGVVLVPGVWIGSNASIAPGVVLKGPVLVGAGCRIERDAQVLPGTVLGEDTLVRSGACVKGAILGGGCRVGPGSVVWDSILDEDVWIGAGCSVTEGAVMGRGCRLTRGMHVAAGQWERRDERYGRTLPLLLEAEETHSAPVFPDGRRTTDPAATETVPQHRQTRVAAA